MILQCMNKFITYLDYPHLFGKFDSNAHIDSIFKNIFYDIKEQTNTTHHIVSK